MKRPILFLYVLLVAIITISIAIDAGDDLAERIASLLLMTKRGVQICFNKTSVRFQDFMQLDRIIDDNMRVMDLDNSALRVGCFFACLLQAKGAMSGSHINIDKIKELRDTKMNTRAITGSNWIFDTCNERIKSKTNECEVSLTFALCIEEKQRELHKNII